MTNHDENKNGRDEEFTVKAELEQDGVQHAESSGLADDDETSAARLRPSEPETQVDQEPAESADSPFGASPLKDMVREESAPLTLLRFKTTNKTASKAVVLEYGGTLGMIRETTVTDLENIRNCPEYALYLSELDQSFGLMNVTGDPKYASVMGRKELEDRGELTADGQLFVHGTKKIDATQAVVLYSVFSRQKYMGISAAYKDHDKGFELFDPVGLLYGLLKSMSRSQPHALALRLGATVVLLVGRRDEIMLVRRYSLYGQDDESLAETVNALVQDVILLEENMGMSLSQINWIEAMSFDLNLRVPETQIPLYPWAVTRLTWDGREAWSALPALADRIPVSASVGPKDERYLKPLDTAVNWLLAAGVLLTLAFGAGYYLYSSALDQLKAGVGEVEAAYHKELSELRAMTVNLESLDTETFLRTAEAVEQAVLAPTMGEMWNVLAATRPHVFQVHGVELRYDRDQVLVRLEGTLDETMGRAQEAFAGYITEMERMGFVLVDQNLNIDLERIDYLLQLQWPIKRGS